MEKTQANSVQGSAGSLRRRWGGVACAAAMAAAALMAFPATPVSATPILTLDLTVSGTGGKSAIVSAINDVVTLDLYAYVADGDSVSNEWLQSTHGSILGSNGGLGGDLSPIYNPNTSFSLRQAGGQNDLDSDGDLDVGGPVVTSVTDYIVYAGVTQNAVPVTGLYLGQVDFTATSLSGTPTGINWEYRVRTTGPVGQQNLNWFGSDGTTYNVRGDSSLIGVGAPVEISYVPLRQSVVPEPGSISLLALAAGTALLKRRRVVE